MPRKRNDEVNEATSQAIKDTARRLMAESGTGGLSIRGIAKALDMTPPALYHYFDSLDDLITALILESFNAFADALENARATHPEDDPIGQLLAVILTYRQWAVSNEIDFQLIYGTPIPGYIAPREVTVPAVIRSFVVTVGLIEKVFQMGLAVPTPPHDTIPPEIQPQIQAMIARDNYPVSELAFYLGIVGWEQLHGRIILEINHHTGPVLGSLEVHYRDQAIKMLRSFGIKI